jgi:hypothetical protein
MALGHRAEAERLLTDAEAILERQRGRRREAQEAAERLARLYEQTDRTEKASALRARIAH